MVAINENALFSCTLSGSQPLYFSKFRTWNHLYQENVYSILFNFCFYGWNKCQFYGKIIFLVSQKLKSIITKMLLDQGCMSLTDPWSISTKIVSQSQNISSTQNCSIYACLKHAANECFVHNSFVLFLFIFIIVCGQIPLFCFYLFLILNLQVQSACLHLLAVKIATSFCHFNFHTMVPHFCLTSCKLIVHVCQETHHLKV